MVYNIFRVKKRKKQQQRVYNSKIISNFAFMKIIADSGSTKTDWLVTEDDKQIAKINTQGINPFHMTEDTIRDILKDELLPELSRYLQSPGLQSIEFYGAGCTTEKRPIMAKLIAETLPSCPDIIVDSDLLGAAKALCGNTEGIACILGTGANSCLYDGRGIVKNVSPMGYILGDEGSGAVIGRTFITELYKGAHQDFIPTFEQETSLSQPEIIQRVYREPLPNRFLASLCPFISKHKANEPWIHDMLTDCFRLFFKRNIRHYGRRDLPVNFIGSIAFYFKEELTTAAKAEGFTIGIIKKTPL